MRNTGQAVECPASIVNMIADHYFLDTNSGLI